MEYQDGSFYLAIGGSGGPLILSSMFQVILNLDWGLDVSQAIEYGRVHDQLLPPVAIADDIIEGTLLDALRERGHNVIGEICLYSTRCALTTFLQSKKLDVLLVWSRLSYKGMVLFTVRDALIIIVAPSS